MTRWRCRSSTLHECSDGAPRGSPSTPATKSGSSANSPPDTSQSSSGALPGARTPGRNGPASRSPVCATPSPTSHGPCTGEIAIFASTATTDSLLHNESKTSSPRSTETPPASSGDNPKRPPSGPGQAQRAITRWGHLPPSQWSQLGGSGALCVNRGLCRAWTVGEHGTPGSSDRDASEYSPGQVVGRRQVDKPLHAKR